MAQTIDYILLLTITAIVIYILYRIISKSVAGSAPVAPPFDNVANSAQMRELNSVIAAPSGVAITNAAFPATEDNALRNFCIKSSFNSAYTGRHMNLDMIKYVLQRGCRFLDFQVFIKDNTAIVAYSQDDYIDAFTSNPPALSLGGVFSTINMNAFNQNSPNPNDPLFIQIRILSNLPAATSIVAETIASAFSANLYADPATGFAIPIDLNVQMNQLQSKVVIITDQRSTADGNQLSKYVNLITGTANVRTYTENQLTYQPINPPDPYVYNFKIVLPDLGYFFGISNSDATYLIKKYGAQVVAQAFYSQDLNLTNYEAIFNEYRSAFIPISSFVE
jgi:hypothetical protein